ncbi:MAG: hypothetical protein ACI9IV_001160 [Paracoccaceae bacterium]
MAQRGSIGLNIEEFRLQLGLQHSQITKLCFLGLLPSFSGRKLNAVGRAALVYYCTYENPLGKYETVKTWAKATATSEKQFRRTLKITKLARAPEGDGIPIYRIDDLLGI